MWICNVLCFGLSWHLNIKKREIKDLFAQDSIHSALPVQADGVAIISNDPLWFFLNTSYKTDRQETQEDMMESGAQELWPNQTVIIENELSVKLNPPQMDECTTEKNSRVCNTEEAQESVMKGGCEYRMCSALFHSFILLTFVQDHKPEQRLTSRVVSDQ